MDKLVDVFNTKYFASHWAIPVSRYLEEHKEADIADARLTKSIVDVITLAVGKGAVIIDTANESRNAILEENRNRASADYGIERRLPKLLAYNKLYDYIKALDDKVTYTVDSTENILIPVAVLVSVFRPKVKINFGDRYVNMFKYVCMNLYPNTHKWDKFYLLTGSTFRVIDIVDDSVYLPLEGVISYEDLMNRFFVIPYDFGRKYLEGEPEWNRFIDRVIEDLEEQMQPNSNKLRDFI